MDCSPPGSSVHGILQARILEWVAIPSSRAFSPPRDQTSVSCLPALARGFFIASATWEVHRYVYWQICLESMNEGLVREGNTQVGTGGGGSECESCVQAMCVCAESLQSCLTL